MKHDALASVARTGARNGSAAVDVMTREPLRPSPGDDGCFHGGAFFEAIGDGFGCLERRQRVIPADVLDAWFPPSPAVLDTLRCHLEWIVRTSPPTNGEGLVRALSVARGVPASSIVLGGGSSDLIFMAFTMWLRPESRVLLLDPTYGEYEHVLTKVVGCRVDRLRLRRERQYRLDPTELALMLRSDYDLVVLVNPNSPTGHHVPLRVMTELIGRVSCRTRVWVDETYVEYAGSDQSLERLAARSERLIVCKSMSKMYALSGVRAAYLVTGSDAARALRRRTPPWAIGLPGQIAAVRALESPMHYLRYWSMTHRYRRELASRLEAIRGLEVIPGVANFLLLHLGERHPDAATVVRRCRVHGLFLRDAGRMSASLGDRAIRMAVRDRVTNLRMLEIFQGALRSG